jgi:hypothetical protein
MKAGIQVFELMSNDERVKLIRSELPSIISTGEYDLVDYFLTCANICKHNRNAIAHAHLGDQAPSENILLSTGRGSQRVFTVNLADLREMADATYATALFGRSIWAAICLRLNNHALRGFPPGSYLSSLEKPSLPRSWGQIREVPRPPEPQPQLPRG